MLINVESIDSDCGSAMMGSENHGCISPYRISFLLLEHG